jgi:sirohydrochlorin ferrochelatase
MTGLILFAHGSPIDAANEAVRVVASRIRRLNIYDRVDASFLDSAPPNLPEAVGQMVTAGMTRVIVVPYFLVPGLHITRDLPRIVDELRGIYQAVGIEVAESLDGHPAVLEAVLDRARNVHGGSDSEGQAD